MSIAILRYFNWIGGCLHRQSARYSRGISDGNTLLKGFLPSAGL